MMKHWKKRAAALALALVLTAGLVPGALASPALGDELHSGIVGLAPGSLLTRNLFWSNTYSDLRTERFFTYQPTEGVFPTVVYGDKVLNKQSISAMAASLEAKGLRVVGGVNGDFFDMSTGNTLGVLISDGILRSTSGGFHAVGFRKDGTAFIGTPDIAVTATFLGSTLRITDVNKTRTALGNKTPGGYYLYTEDYSKTTQHTGPGVDVILTPVTSNLGNEVQVDLDVTNTSPPVTPSPSPTIPGTTPSPAVSPSPDVTPTPTPMPEEAPEGIPFSEGPVTAAESTDLPAAVDTPPADVSNMTEVTGSYTLTDKLTVGGRVQCTVDQVLQSTGSIDIPAGKMVLTINSQNPEWLLSQITALKPGDTVDLDVTTADTRWEEAVTALGGFYRIVAGGQPGPHTDKNANPRTAIGIKADGTVIIYAIDGKQPGSSVGATLAQVAQRLIELGCVDAVGLDGGGSTTMVATMPTQTASELLNRPSDGSQRAVSTGLFLVSQLKPTGTMDHFYLFPYDALLLAGASVTLYPTAMDTAYYPMTQNQPLAWSIHNGDGTVTNDGIFTAGGEAGMSTVSVSSGAATGSAGMTVVRTPDTITLTYEGATAPLSALSLEPNQTAQLNAAAVWKKQPLISQNNCYTWTLDPAVGTIDATGRITAGPQTASGNLTVAAGGNSVTIPVSVTGHIKQLEPFEAGVGTFVSSDTVTVAPETGSDLVRSGSGSLKLTYDTTATGSATAGMSYAIPAGERYLGLWVYGDGSGNALTATATDQTGQSAEMVLTGLDFTGWKQIVAAMPEGTVSLNSIHVISGGTEQVAGELWMDQLTTSNENMTDTSAPVLQIALSGTAVTAKIFDSLDKRFEQTAITFTVDGVAQPFQWDTSKSTLTATIAPSDGKLHRLTVTATDQSGNLGRASTDQLVVPDSSGTSAAGPFVDMTAHWALPYTTYLHDKGIVNGVSTSAGLTFKPDTNITRGEFALMVARWMGLDMNASAEVALPFADLAAIPDWALPGIRAMYHAGIIKGSLEGGVLVSRATATISRAEAMTILGRIQPKGYEQKPLTFTDGASVPAWSLTYVQTLTGQGVVTGYENQLRPNDPVKRAEVAKMLYSIR